MAEYISREAALSAQNKSMNLAEMRERLKRIPAADVRPVVLCRDCKYADYAGMGCGVWCDELEHAMQEDDFCSRGEKREES